MKIVKITFFASVILAMASCTGNTSKNAADTSAYTKIQWLDSIVNFGTADMGQVVQVVFHFRNTGDKPLFLTNVKAGCGCTVPDYTKGAIAPGQEGVVTGAFDTGKSQHGKVSKNIFVTTNTQSRTEHTLTFTGIIAEKATGSP